MPPKSNPKTMTRAGKLLGRGSQEALASEWGREAGNRGSSFECVTAAQGPQDQPQVQCCDRRWKDSRNSEELLYSWLPFITAKGSRLISAKGKA